MTDELMKIPADLAGMIAAERPEGVDDGYLGTEGITKDDILVPRLGVAQKTSPELDSTNSRYIEGLAFIDMFNSVSRQKYGKGPLHFVVLRRDDPRGVEFRPLEQGGGVIDPNVPLDDPRMKFGEVDAAGKAAKPQATKFYDFMILILNDLDLSDAMQNVVSLSLKSSGIKVAKKLNMLITQRGKKALYKGVYSVRSDSETKAGNTYAVYDVKNAGWLTPDSPLEKLAAEAFASWKDLKVKVDLDTAAADGADEVPFDVPPAEGASAEM